MTEDRAPRAASRRFPEQGFQFFTDRPQKAHIEPNDLDRDDRDQPLHLYLYHALSKQV